MVCLSCCFSIRRYAVRSRDSIQYSMETDTTFQDIPASIKESLVENRVLLRVYYKAGSYMTFQAEGNGINHAIFILLYPPPLPPSPSLTLVYEIADNLLSLFVPDAPAKRVRLGLPQDV